MKYIDEYRNPDLAKRLTDQIHKHATRPVKFMEVCGGHTMAIRKFGIRELLPEKIRLVSGPGCPVCVSDIRFINQAIALSRLTDVIITTFGDLIRVPGSTSSLANEKAGGADVRIIFSSLDAVRIAVQNPEKRVVFLGIGFETTSPGTAAAIEAAYKENVSNFFVLSSHKVMPPAMKGLIDEKVALDGYIAPGHVSTITGSKIYDFIAEQYKLPVVVTGFEPVDLLQSVLMLVKQIEQKAARVEIQYKRAVKSEGNMKAQALLKKIFRSRDDWWRGLGVLPDSGMEIRKEYSRHDAEVMIEAEVEEPVEPKGCICGEILKGLKDPEDCKLYGRACKPENPVGACMVSTEGACNAHFRYRDLNKS